MKLEFSRRIFEKYSNTKFHKSRPMGTEFFHDDRQTDMTQLVDTFHNFVNAPTNRWASVLAHVLWPSGL